MKMQARGWAAPTPDEKQKPKGDTGAKPLPPFPIFAGSLDILPKEGGRMRFAKSAWNVEQRHLAKHRTRRDITLKGRQQGISTWELAWDLYTPLAKPGTHTLILTHDDDTATAFDEILTEMMVGLERDGLLPPISTNRVGQIVFKETGSTLRIKVAGATERTAKKKGRGRALERLHGTEVAHWGAAGATLASARAAVRDGGVIVLESTANGAAGAFYDEWRRARAGGDNEYATHFLPWWWHEEYRRTPASEFDARPRDEHERAMRKLGVDDGQIAWWRAKLAESGDIEVMLQEYPYSAEVAFRASGGNYIDAATCDWLATHVREPLREYESRGIAVRVYEEPRDGVAYLIGADCSEGIAHDAHAGDVVVRSTGRTVATLWGDRTEPGDFAEVLADVGAEYHTAVIAPERNNTGHTVIDRLVNVRRYPKVYVHDDKRHGWLTTPATRPPLFDEQADTWRGKPGHPETRALPSPDARVAAEARTLTRVNGKPQARGKGTKSGARDDAFVARAIATQVRQRIGTGKVTEHESIEKRVTAQLGTGPDDERPRPRNFSIG